MPRLNFASYRGAVLKFTRVSAKATVESANIISLIHTELGALDGMVINFRIRGMISEFSTPRACAFPG